MKTISSGSKLSDTAEALRESLTGYFEKTFENPNYVMIQVSSNYDLELVRQVTSEYFCDASIHGATSCRGALSSDGAMSFENYGIAVFGIHDEEGDYGSATASFEGICPKVAASCAVEAAIDDAGRSGQLPDLVWVSSSPGYEEDVINGLQEIVGPETVIIGGSSADNNITGEWSVFDNKEILSNGVLVSVLFPSVSFGTSFECTYDPTEHKGRVTAAKQRIIHEIDGVKARDKYNSWTKGLLGPLPSNETSNILGLSSLTPLGRRVGAVGGVDCYVLSHPETVTSDGDITLFSSIEVDDDVTLMQGTPSMLVNRAAKVVRSAMSIGEIPSEDISGAIIVYCAGCMLTVQDRVDEICLGLSDQLKGAPFIGAFTFGEQGRIMNNSNRHGNLMVSAVVFGR